LLDLDFAGAAQRSSLVRRAGTRCVSVVLGRPFV
jgi:hypothetical protein